MKNYYNNHLDIDREKLNTMVECGKKILKSLNANEKLVEEISKNYKSYNNFSLISILSLIFWICPILIFIYISLNTSKRNYWTFKKLV